MAPKKDPMAALSKALCQRDLAMAQALIIREAAIAASETFRHYAALHRGKGDEDKARRNEDEAYRLTAAIMATANLPDFRAHSARVEADLARVTAERDAARAEVEAMRERVRDVVSSCAFDCNEESYCGTCGALLRAIALRARKVGG